MKHHAKKTQSKEKALYDGQGNVHEDLFERCIKKGLIEKTPYGYYFTPEFFETLELYNEE